MSGTTAENVLLQVPDFPAIRLTDNTSPQSPTVNRSSFANKALLNSMGPRRTPRKSLVVVLPANHAMPADAITERLAENDQDDVDVIVACAGRPSGLTTLQHRIPDLRVLLAPAGTSGEQLRELAIEQASGDIVTMLSGFAPGREDA